MDICVYWLASWSFSTLTFAWLIHCPSSLITLHRLQSSLELICCAVEKLLGCFKFWCFWERRYCYRSIFGSYCLITSIQYFFFLSLICSLASDKHCWTRDSVCEFSFCFTLYLLQIFAFHQGHVNSSIVVQTKYFA